MSMKFQLLIKTKMLKNKDFSCFKTLLLINDKMPSIVGTLTYMNRLNFVLSLFEHEKKVL